MTRAVLPQRRRADTFDLSFGGIDYAVSVGRYPSGAVGELFVACHKAGSTIADLARDAAIMISLALQHGASVETLASAVTRSADGSAAGLAGAMLDAIARHEAEGAVMTPPQAHADEPRPAPMGFLAGALPKPERPTTALGGFSGDVCATCHNATMVRTGTCLTCQACGSSSGGCS